MGLTVEKCLLAWTNSFRQMNAKADIVFFGDSLIFYGDFASVFPDKVVCNLGLRGDTIKGLIDRVEQVQLLKPKRVFLMVGINDVAHITADEFEMLYNRLLDSIIQVLPETAIIVQNILPINSKFFCLNCDNAKIDACNNRLQKIIEGRNLDYLDVHSLYVEDGQLPLLLTRDGIHLITLAYDRWYELLKEKYKN